MSLLDEVLPAQKYDETPVTNAARTLLQALTSPGAKEQPRLTVELGPDEWRALEAQFRRPYRPHSSSKLLAVEGVGWVEFKRAKVDEVGEVRRDLRQVAPGLVEYHGRPPSAADYQASFDAGAVALLPEAAAAISEAKAERQAWTPDAVMAKGALPVEAAVVLEADYGTAKGESK